METIVKRRQGLRKKGVKIKNLGNLEQITYACKVSQEKSSRSFPLKVPLFGRIVTFFSETAFFLDFFLASWTFILLKCVKFCGATVVKCPVCASWGFLPTNMCVNHVDKTEGKREACL